MARKKLGELLMQAGVIDENRLRIGLREQQRWGGQLGRVLVNLGLVSEEELVRALSAQLAIPVAPDLVTAKIHGATLDLVPEDFCVEHSIIPFNQDGKFLDVALCDPTNLSILDEVRIRTKLNVRAFIVGPTQLERALRKHYRGMDALMGPSRDQAAVISHMGNVLPTSPVNLNSGARVVTFEPSVSAAKPAHREPPPLPKAAQPPPPPADVNPPPAPTPAAQPTPTPEPLRLEPQTQQSQMSQIAIPGETPVPPVEPPTDSSPRVATPLSSPPRMGGVPMVPMPVGNTGATTPHPPPTPVEPSALSRAPGDIPYIDALAFERLQKRVTELESFLARDESVLRRLLGLLLKTKVVTREQILACLQE
jgi:hypothetical protein